MSEETIDTTCRLSREVVAQAKTLASIQRVSMRAFIEALIAAEWQKSALYIPEKK